MNSKEALELLYKNCPMVVVRENDGINLYSEYLVEIIKQDIDRLEKLEKAIKILKEKIIDRRKLLNSKNVEEYNNYALCGFGFFDILTQEEYDLLKEVLNDRV